MSVEKTGLSSNAGRAGFIINIIFTIIAIVSVGLRVWAKTITKRPTIAHDLLIYGAAVFGLAYSVGYACCIYPGIVGLHTKDALQTKPGAQITTYKLFFLAAFTWIIATTLVKLSVLQLYHYIFQGESRKYIQGRSNRYANQALHIVVLLFCVGHIIAVLVECRPIEKQWNKSMTTGHCMDVQKREVSNASINMLLDLGIVILPMPVLWTLQMPTGTKLKVGGIFGLGIFICIINIARLAVTTSNEETDPTYHLTFIGLLCGLEIYLGIIVACFPLFSSLVFRKKNQSSNTNQPLYSSNNTIGTRKRNKRFGNELSVLEPAQEDIVSLRGNESESRSTASTSVLNYNTRI